MCVNGWSKINQSVQKTNRVREDDGEGGGEANG
jgi:hypothetical protein